MPSPYLCDGGEHDEDEEVVGHHQPLLQQEAPHTGQRVLLLHDSPVQALVPVAEVHDINVIGHVGNKDPDVLHSQPVPREGAAHTQASQRPRAPRDALEGGREALGLKWKHQILKLIVS